MIENRAPSHFIYLGLLALFWGSAFVFVKFSLESLTPLTISAGRVGIGAIIVTLIALKMGRKLPDNLSDWLLCTVIGVTGTVIPFFLLNWSIQYVPSSLAAICMSLSPLFTITLAHFMTRDEKISANKLIGVFFGTLGVGSLFYGTVTDIGPSNTVYLALLGLLATSFSYAFAGVLVRKLDNKDHLSTASAMLISATLITVPLALIFENPLALNVTPTAIYSVIILGVFATGLGSLILFHLTHLAGATFVSYNTYLIPLVGLTAGYFWLDEAIKMITIISVTLIFSGIYLAEKRKKPHG